MDVDSAEYSENRASCALSLHSLHSHFEFTYLLSRIRCILLPRLLTTFRSEYVTVHTVQMRLPIFADETHFSFKSNELESEMDNDLTCAFSLLLLFDSFRVDCMRMSLKMRMCACVSSSSSSSSYFVS